MTAKKRITITLDHEIAERMIKSCEKNKRSMSGEISYALEQLYEGGETDKVQSQDTKE